MPNSRLFNDQFGNLLNPGVLRHRITWQRRTVVGRDSHGDDIVQWPDVITCAARVRSLVGRELEAVQQQWAEARYAIEQHYVPGLTPADRINWYVDGTVRLLDVLDVGEPAGSGVRQVIYAKDHVES